MFNLKNITTGKDITPYIISADWNGDLDQAARKLSFQIAYTKKDKNWTNAIINVGDRVSLTYTTDTTAAQAETKQTPSSPTTTKADTTKTDTAKTSTKNGSAVVFQGVVFLQSRNSASFTMDFTAYDNIVYLAKSKTTVKFSGCTIKDAITQVCNSLGVTVGTMHDDCSKYQVNLVEDGKSGSEIIKDCLDVATAWTGWTYHITMVDNKLNVVRCDNTVQSYKITDTTNLIDASHSNSIEDMVNQVQVLDKDGNIMGYVKNDDDIKKYGLLQDVYKVEDKKNTQQAAKAMLKKMAGNSSISCIGDIQCISGYAVDVTDEQINGKFLISADSHKLAGNKHTMDLTLRYIVQESQSAGSKTEGNVPDAVYVDPKSKKKKAGTFTSSGNLPVDQGLASGANAWVGTTMANGTEGCAEAVGKVGSWYSPFLKQECNAGVVSVPRMCEDAGSNCIPFDSSKLEKGDVIVYGNRDHVVIAAGPSGDYVGNSSGQNQVVHGDDYTQMGGLYPTEIIKTSHM